MYRRGLYDDTVRLAPAEFLHEGLRWCSVRIDALIDPLVAAAKRPPRDPTPLLALFSPSHSYHVTSLRLLPILRQLLGIPLRLQRCPTEAVMLCSRYTLHYVFALTAAERGYCLAHSLCPPPPLLDLPVASFFSFSFLARRVSHQTFFTNLVYPRHLRTSTAKRAIRIDSSTPQPLPRTARTFAHRRANVCAHTGEALISNGLFSTRLHKKEFPDTHPYIIYTYILGTPLALHEEKNIPYIQKRSAYGH